jgi:uncharacterized protein (DUF433 family)
MQVRRAAERKAASQRTSQFGGPADRTEAPGLDSRRQGLQLEEETAMSQEYIEQRNGGYYVAGTRISLDSLVYSFQSGDSPETIRQNFPSLTLEQVYGAIAFYLAHEAEVQANIREGEADLDQRVPHLSQSRPELYARLQQAREELAKH